MLEAKWKCSKCNNEKITEYKDDDFTKESLYEFKTKSIHYCPKCKEYKMHIIDTTKTCK